MTAPTVNRFVFLEIQKPFHIFWFRIYHYSSHESFTGSFTIIPLTERKIPLYELTNSRKQIVLKKENFIVSKKSLLFTKCFLPRKLRFASLNLLGNNKMSFVNYSFSYFLLIILGVFFYLPLLFTSRRTILFCPTFSV